MATGLFTLKQVNQALRQRAWSGTQKTPSVEYLVVAGGGGGSNGGGGAGGLLTGILPVAIGTSITATVGGGGADNTNGQNSVFGNITAIGGGGGGNQGTGDSGRGANGGSGGGQGYGRVTGSNYTAGQGIVGQGNAGALGYSDLTTYTKGGGGGGAGTIAPPVLANVNGGNAGVGVASSINGTVTTYAGGGGGAPGNGGTGGLGGAGGGGAGVYTGTSNSGTANTGGGGGGNNQAIAGNGGSGIVIIRYPSTFADAASVTTGTKTTANGYTIYTFLASGTITF